MTRPSAEASRRGGEAIRRRAEENRRNVSRGHVAAALAERAQPAQPLVVESLAAKLERLLPGARLEDGGSHMAGEDRHQVWRGERVLATGSTAHEAVDRAVFLWGRR